MLNIVDLEKRWIKYKIKSYIPHITIVISLVIITVISLTFISTDSASKTDNILIETPVLEKISSQDKIIPQEFQVPTPKPIVKKEAPIERDKPITSVEEIHYTDKVHLTPSLDFMRKMQNSMQPYYKNDINSHEPSYNNYQAKKVEKVTPPKVEVVEQQQVIEEEYKLETQSKKIEIKHQNTQNDIHEIINRFKKNNNPALSLFVAKKYYELGDYEQAYNYALITNKINKDIESSWIIFTKSLIKLGKKDKAIVTLKQYIKQSHSSSARILLDEIYSGKFK